MPPPWKKNSTFALTEAHLHPLGLELEQGAGPGGIKGKGRKRKTAVPQPAPSSSPWAGSLDGTNSEPGLVPWQLCYQLSYSWRLFLGLSRLHRDVIYWDRYLLGSLTNLVGWCKAYRPFYCGGHWDRFFFLFLFCLSELAKPSRSALAKDTQPDVLR